MNVTTEILAIRDNIESQLIVTADLNKFVTQLSWKMSTLLTELEGASDLINYILKTGPLNLSPNLRNSLDQLAKDSDSLKLLLSNSELYRSICSAQSHQEEQTALHKDSSC